MRILSFIAILLFLTLGIARAQSDQLPDGVLFYSEGAADKPAIVLAHDWFGDSPLYRHFASQLADVGYTVIASDLYDGAKGATNHRQAGKLLQSLTNEHAASVLDANINRASQQAKTVIVFGFSAGVPHAFEAAIRNRRTVDGTVVFYGAPITDADKLKNLGGPVLAVYGSKDPIYGADGAAGNAAQLSKAADQAGATINIHIYGGADHAFAQPLYNGGRAYDPAVTASAWRLALDFIESVAAD